MKKRANVPIFVLVIGIFLVCALGILSFLMFKFQLNDSLYGVGLTEKVKIKMERYLSFGEGSSEIVRSNGESYFYEEKLSGGFLGFGKERKIFSVKYNLP